MLHRVWKYGDNINTDLIYSGRYTYTVLDRQQMGQYALEDLDADFATQAQAGDVIVGGTNWGNGSSREQAVNCLVELGIRAVIAKSFARIYYRNAINNGLLVIQCPAVVDAVTMHDQLELDLEQSRIGLNGVWYPFPSLPASVQHILNAGGLIPYLKTGYKPTT
jgi:3-isopropylmalate/(R)-2-methylmalate dehydratase small subunit